MRPGFFFSSVLRICNYVGPPIPPPNRRTLGGGSRDSGASLRRPQRKHRPSVRCRPRRWSLAPPDQESSGSRNQRLRATRSRRCWRKGSRSGKKEASRRLEAHGLAATRDRAGAASSPDAKSATRRGGGRIRGPLGPAHGHSARNGQSGGPHLGRAAPAGRRCIRTEGGPSACCRPANGIQTHAPLQNLETNKWNASIATQSDTRLTSSCGTSCSGGMSWSCGMSGWYSILRMSQADGGSFRLRDDCCSA